MKHKYTLRYIFALLLTIFILNSCSEKEDEVIPQATCDTVATVEYLPGCGLQLVLANGKALIPLNAKQTKAEAGKEAFEVNGFQVKAGQQIIIGYEITDKTLEPSSCNNGKYYQNKLVNVTCIVGIKTVES